MNPESGTLVCEQCGRGLRDIANCTERTKSNCPFAVTRKTRIDSITIAFLLSFVFLCLRLGWLALFVFAISLGLWILSSDITLENIKANVWIRQRTIAGIEISFTWTSKIKVLLPVNFELNHSFAYPHSVSALTNLPESLSPNKQDTGALFRSTLIGMLAGEAIEVYRQDLLSGNLENLPKVDDSYGFALAKKEPQASTPGFLEYRILDVLKDRTDGDSVYELVRGVFGSDRKSPDSWLAEQVANNAFDLGFARKPIRKSRSHKIEWNPDKRESLNYERLAALSLSYQLQNKHPGFSRVMDSEILRAISSRRESSGGGGCGCGCG
jgi:hypothetical protein